VIADNAPPHVERHPSTYSETNLLFVHQLHTRMQASVAAFGRELSPQTGSFG
jgi:hypothetical protein